MCDLNTASAAEIMQLAGIDQATAYDLALWAPYRSWHEVEDAPCWAPGLVQTLRAAGAVLSPSTG